MSVGGAIIICPPEEALQVQNQRNVPCTEPGCGRIFATPSSQRFHMIKVHKRVENDMDAAVHHRSAGVGRTGPDAGAVCYHCPVAGCKYTTQQGRFFTSMKNLKQHYMHVHAEKKFHCSRCKHGFGQLRNKERHERTCEVKFVCRQCGNVYNSKEALQVHCARQGHTSGFTSIDSQLIRSAVEISATTQPPTTSLNVTDAQPQSESTNQSDLNANAKSMESQTIVNNNERQEVTTNTTLEITHMPSAPSAFTAPIPPPLPLPQSLSKSPPKDPANKNHPISVLPVKPRPTQPYILPKPDALYMPVQLQIDKNNMSLFAGQSGPVVLIVNNTTVEQPKKLKAIAPKTSNPGGATPPAGTGGAGRVKGQGREMEVQTEPLQPLAFPNTSGAAVTNELSIQTSSQQNIAGLPACDDVSNQLSGKGGVVAETQTTSYGSGNVQQQSKSSQVSPDLRQPPTTTTSGTLMVEGAVTKSKQKRRKRAEIGSQTGHPKQSVSVGTPPKKHRRRRSAAVGSSNEVVEAGLTQGSQAGTDTYYTINMGDLRNGPTAEASAHTVGSEQFFLPSASSSRSEASVCRVSASVGTMPTLPTLESIGVGTMSPSALGLGDISLSSSQSHNLTSSSSTAGSVREMVSVSTDMSRVNISVGTMPSPPLPSTFGGDFSTVSMNTIGTDPLPGFSGSSRDLGLSSMFSQETQTSFWAEFQASMAENNATQTIESFLADSTVNGASLDMPSLMESGVQTGNAQHTHTQTWSPLDDTAGPSSSQSKSVGVGTSLLGDQAALFEGMETEGFSRSIGIDTQLFDDLFPEVSSRSVAISTPLFDNVDSPSMSGQPSTLESAIFQPIDHQRSVGVSALGPDLADDLDCLSRSSEGQVVASSQTTMPMTLSEGGGEGGSVLQYESIATASVQTDTDYELPVFLTAASQTSQFDSINSQTQTMDMFNQLLSNMETQTSSDILAELNFADIETQTPAMSTAVNLDLASVETQTVSVRPEERPAERPPSAARMSVYIDTETQTLLPNFHIAENTLTDSQTQTKLNEFVSLVDELEKN